jgi:GH15 family glucan-1,4-alpha-glucosidase
MIVKGNSMSMTRGDSESFTVSYTDALGVNIPLVVGDTIYFTVKENITTLVKILQKIITEFDSGTAVVEIDHIDTEAILYGNYYYDVQLTTAAGKVKTIIIPSKFSITGEITYE